MSGPTLAVTARPTVRPAHRFSRSHSASSASSSPSPSLSPSPSPSAAHRLGSAAAAPGLLPSRATPSSSSPNSSPSLPTFDVPSFNLDLDLSLSVRNDAHEASSPNDSPTPAPTHQQPEAPRPRPDVMAGARRKSLLRRPHSWMPGSKSTLDLALMDAENAPEPPSGGTGAGAGTVDQGVLDRSRTLSDSFASFARRSWITSSRSPSPSPKKEIGETTGSTSQQLQPQQEQPQQEQPQPQPQQPQQQTPQPRPQQSRPEPEPLSQPQPQPETTSGSAVKRSKLQRKRTVSTVDGEGAKPAEPMGKIGSYFSRIKQRPQTILAKGATVRDGDSTSSSVVSLAPPSTTNTRLSNATSDTSNTTAPDENQRPALTPQARDPLWSAFRALDSESTKLQAKSVHSKIGAVRSTLIPFLRKYMSHPSNHTVSTEDVERRATILNKWWVGIIDVLDGNDVPGVDRPNLLDTVTALMMRPEWRQCTPQFCPLTERNPRERVRRPKKARDGPVAVAAASDASLTSADSDYLAESAEHNVRTMFVNNLVAQMALVVNKLSQRHAPLGLVGFAARACAYAFFFAPGVAEVLVRLWGLVPDLLRRTADELWLPRRSRAESEDMVALFPPNLESLGWTSVRAMSKTLRQAAKLPLAVAKIPWHEGRWVAKWRGRETDLFFLFCKHYHTLAAEFTPADIPLVEKARAPAFVLVQAQTLANLDSTIHRQAAADAGLGPPISDAAHGVDASAMALPVAPNNSNAHRGMGENRLLVLLKDVLSPGSVTSAGARQAFAEAFMATMKAAAKRTSQFDHNACFTLCDFLEVALVAYNDHLVAMRPMPHWVDWTFWIDVCKRILNSHNTMSEIRVLSLVFTIWDAVAGDQGRRDALCTGWLLTEETFSKLFNNWCPMVRAYYMRLLCWRICRDSGNTTELGAKTFLVAAARLKTVWSHYLWLRDDAQKTGTCPPSTAPSFPTPGKRFMIIRTEATAVQPGLLVGFDPPSTSFLQSPEVTFEPLLADLNTPPAGEAATYRKKWGLLGKVLSLTTGNNTEDREAADPDDTAATHRPPAPPPKHTGDGPATPPSSDTDSIGSSPVYETQNYVFKFTLSWNPVHTMSPPERILTRPRLPMPAQSWVVSRGQNGVYPPMAGRPAPTRAVSGGPQMGLIEAARNADPSEVPPAAHRISTTVDRRGSIASPVSPTGPVDGSEREPCRPPGTMPPTQEAIIHPAKPEAVFAPGAKYSGRALAEWSLVVAECNSFIDRRREEGVLGLRDVEVPSLEVEGFRKPAS